MQITGKATAFETSRLNRIDPLTRPQAPHAEKADSPRRAAVTVPDETIGYTGGPALNSEDQALLGAVTGFRVVRRGELISVETADGSPAEGPAAMAAMSIALSVDAARRSGTLGTGSARELVADLLQRAAAMGSGWPDDWSKNLAGLPARGMPFDLRG